MDELELIVEEVVEVSLTMSDQLCKLCTLLLRVCFLTEEGFHVPKSRSMLILKCYQLM